MHQEKGIKRKMGLIGPLHLHRWENLTFKFGSLCQSAWPAQQISLQKNRPGNRLHVQIGTRTFLGVRASNRHRRPIIENQSIPPSFARPRINTNIQTVSRPKDGTRVVLKLQPDLSTYHSICHSRKVLPICIRRSLLILPSRCQYIFVSSPRSPNQHTTSFEESRGF